MGYGEYYTHRWHEYYESLSDEDRKKYREMNPQPESWKGFYKNIENHLSNKGNH